LGVAVWRRLLHARSARDVTDAFATWVDPVDRVLAADRHEVLSVTAGRVPRRDRAERALPLPGWTDAGRVRPWVALPPPVVVHDVAVDADERPERPGTDLGHTYAPPHRARRVRALLDATGPAAGGRAGSPADGAAYAADGAATAADQARVHADTLLGGADDLLRWLDDDPREGGPANVRRGATVRAAARLRAWDRRMDAGSTDAALFAAWRSALVRRVAAPPALAPPHAPHGPDEVFAPGQSVPGRVADALPALLGAAWLGIDGPAEAWAALAEVAHADDGRTGPAPTWGDTHRVLGLHVLLDVPGAPAPRVPAVPLGGDTDTVRCTASAP